MAGNTFGEIFKVEKLGRRQVYEIKNFEVVPPAQPVVTAARPAGGVGSPAFRAPLDAPQQRHASVTDGTRGVRDRQGRSRGVRAEGASELTAATLQELRWTSHLWGRNAPA